MSSRLHSKDLTSSSLPPSEVDDQSEENSQRLKSTWSRVRNTLGAPLPDYQELTKADDRGPNGEDSDSVSEEDTNETENADIDLPEYNEADPNNETKQLETCPTDTNPISSGPREFELKQLYHQVLMSTTPSSRRLDLSSVEVEEVEKHGTLQSRKQKVQAARKGTSVRSLLAEEQGGAHVFAEGICWALEETCKSIHHRLHSRASAIVITTDSQLVEMRLSARQRSLQRSILISSVLNSANLDNTSHICRSFRALALETSLQGLATVAGVRNGSRLSPAKKSCLSRILGSTLDLLCDEKSKDCHELSSTTAIFVLDHLSRFHSSLPDAPLEQPDSQKMSLKECYDWISISSLLPIDNIAVHHDEIDEWCQHLLMIPAPSGFDVSEGLRARYISDSESGTPINRTMLLSTMLNVARRLCSTGNSRSRTLLLDCLPFIVEIWGWDRGILNTVREICQDARDRFPLKAALLSESHAIRHLTLEILMATSPSASPLEASLKQCLKIVDTLLLVENARIRQMHIRKLSTLAQANDDSVSSTYVVDMIYPPLDARLDIQSYEAKDEDLEQGHLLGRSARSRLRNWLRMFSNTNPKAFYRSQDLRGAFYDLLADPDSDLRALSFLKKPAILSAFKGCVTEESDLLVELMLRRLTSSRSNSQNNLASAVKRQLGFLSLLGDVLKTLGRQLVHRWDDFLNQIMQFVLDSQSHIQTLINNANSQHVFLESQLKKVRVQTLHRLNDFFQLSPTGFSFQKWCFRSLKTYHNIELHPAEVIAEQYLKPYFGTLLPDLAELLRKASSASSLTTCISRQQIVLMSSLAITDTTHSERFCELILTLQLKNQVIVAEHIQAGCSTF
ncbi:hypothetical protein KEM48_003442 [Puccinia striiformis f. sp. tritici PST-130]|nr:hypothetical protein KEM48_003442 [Puccinia striiformis f. sp. tritici PST-130]